MFSKSCEYALKAILHIASGSVNGTKMGIKEISEELDLPRPYLSKILQILVRQNIIQSSKGRNGGFYLNESSSKIKIIYIIEKLDGLHQLTKCGLGLKECSNTHPCPIHKVYMPYREKLRNILEEKTINDLNKIVLKGEAFINN